MRYCGQIKIACVVLLLCCSPVLPQTPERVGRGNVGAEIGIDGTNCENTKSVLVAAAQAAGEDATIIIIARLGSGEFLRSVARRRLAGAKDYLEAVGGIRRERLVTAQGERVRGLGKVEVYVGGKLYEVFALKRNKGFWRGCSTA